MLNALNNAGYQFILSRFMSKVDMTKESPEVKDYQYECAWRLANWNILSSEQVSKNPRSTCNDLLGVEKDSYSYNHYKALKSFHENDDLVLKSSLDSARLSIINELRNISLGEIFSKSFNHNHLPY